MGKIEIYHKKPLSIELIKDTFEISFNIKFDKAYWNWRFLNNPNTEKVYISYIIEDGVLAAYYAVSPMVLEYEGNSYKVALSNMTMTHPNHRGKGYFKQLAKALYDDLIQDDFVGVYGFANHNSHYGFRKYLNWQDFSALNIMQVEKTNLRYSKKLNSTISFTEESTDETTLKVVENFEHKPSSHISIIRDFKNLEWRLLKNPSNNYKSLNVVENEKAIAQIIYKTFNTEIDIIEIFYNTDNKLLVIQEAFNYLLNKDKTAVNIWSNLHCEEHLLLEKIGFQEKNFNTYFGFIPFNNNKYLLEYKNWHYRFFDSDIF